MNMYPFESPDNLEGTIASASEARDTAIDWQHWVGEQNLSWGEMADWDDFFTRLAHRFDLVDEFRENGIIG